MTIDQFFTQYNGKAVDWDGVYGPQCVDLIKFYMRDVTGSASFAGNAKDWFYNYGGDLANKYERITNIPTDLNQVPQRGDIIIWDGTLAGSGGYGHIAIYDAKVAPGQFRSFDQNWGGQYCHFVTHNYGSVLGWLRRRPATAPTGGDEMIQTVDQARKIYRMLRPNSGGSEAEIAATAGKRSFASFLNDAQPEITARDNGLLAQAKQLTDMQGTINQLNQTLTAMIQARDQAIADGSKTKAELVAMLAAEEVQLAELAKLTSELETAHDQIKDLQQEAIPVDEKAVVTRWLKSIWDRLFNKEEV